MTKKGLMLLLVLLLIPAVSASFLLNSSNIRTNYGSGEKVDGTITISFTNEFINVNLTSNFNNGNKVIDALSEEDYTCNPLDCSSSYSSTNGEESKIFQLASNQKKYLGLSLDGRINDITGLSFSVTASNQPSCVNPLKIDILDNGVFDGSLKKVGNDYSCVYETGKGCYNNGESDFVDITNTPYCEKIKLIDSERFKIGSWLKKDSSSSPEDNLIMMLFNLQGDELASCDLAQPSLSGGEVSCYVNYSNPEKQDFYVCVRAENEDTTKYMLKREIDNSNSCGFFGYPGTETEYSDYYIFASSAKFENIGRLDFNQANYENILTDIISYADERYNNNCTNRCVIPLVFYGYNSVSLNVYNLSFKYTSGSGSINSKKFYDVNKQEARFSSNKIDLDLSKFNLTLPSETGNYTLVLYIRDEEVLSQEISVGSIPVIKSLTPTIVPAGSNVRLTAGIDRAGKNITSYLWNFGDSQEETSVNYVNHIFSEIDEYVVNLQIGTSDGYTTSRNFVINSVSPKDSINSTIKKYRSRLSNLTLNLANKWYASYVQEVLNISEMQTELRDLELAYYRAENDLEYAEIMNSLSSLNIPSSIQISGSEIPYFLDYEQIDLGVISQLSEEEAENEESVKEGIGRWVEENLNFNLEFVYVNGNYEGSIEQILGVFRLEISNKGDYDSKIYFGINHDGIIKSGDVDYDLNAASFNSVPSEIIFTAENIELDELSMYLSPSLSEIENINISSECNYNDICEEGENSKNCRQDCKPWFRIIFLWIILFAVGIVAYIIMQWWYKVRYETYLFKNRNDIYNILNFISNAKSQGMSDSEINSSLKKSGWTGEQVSYVAKKMRGKAIMPFDFLKFFRKKENRYGQRKSL